MAKKYIRIVGGNYRRTPIAVVDAPGLRPTPDRVRETLYNWLNHFWQGQFEDEHVLDLFAGSGALGLEAASRGAAIVQMVERDAAAVTALRALRNKLDATMVRIHLGDAMTVVHRQSPARYDLVLLDPPFGQGWLERLWPLLPNVLKDGALVYVESDTPISPPEGYLPLRQDRAGAVHYHLLKFAATQN